MPHASDIATPSATLEVLERFGIKPTKALGQNFLVNDAIVGKICELAQIGEADSVLEVGPGIGTLTNALLKRALLVTSIEKDPKLPRVLEHTLAQWQGRFKLIEKDALDVKAEDFAHPLPTKLVANLPYSVAATIVLEYFQRFAHLESATVMVQKEVAQRMAAHPGTKSYGAYTVKLALYAHPEGSFDVSRNDFMPKPHVDSTVIRLVRNDALDEGEPPDAIHTAAIMADAAFASRRKTIMNSCKTFLAGRVGDPARITRALSDAFSQAGIEGSVRGEMLEVEDFIRLGKAVSDTLPEINADRSQQ